jgi:SnoaL-like domain
MASTSSSAALALLLVSLGSFAACEQRPSGAVSTGRFVSVMTTVADAWNHGDARRAAECFAVDARYSSPPDARIRQGRAMLFEFFGGVHGRARPMHMMWHHLAFDERAQVGFGEYTFEYAIRTHGIVIVRIVNGEIANWREYEHESPLDWDAMVGDNRF